MSTDQKTLILRIHGRVQGVWYRAWTVEQARDLGVAGWVRNRSDGTVEALVHGPAAAVDALVARCHDGPAAARVDRVETTPSGEHPEPGFAQKPTV